MTVPVKPQERQITSCRARAGQHARPSHKHCKPCARHAHAPPPRDCTLLHDFHLVEFSHQPVPFPVNNELKKLVICGQLARSILSIFGRGLQQVHGFVHALRTNTAKRAPNMPMHHRHVPVHVCTVSILWDLHTNPYQSSETTS